MGIGRRVLVVGLGGVVGDLALDVVEVGDEGAGGAEGVACAGTGCQEGLARQRAVEAVEGEHGARFALGVGHEAPEQGGELAEDLGQAEARLGVGARLAAPQVEEFLELAGAASGCFGCACREGVAGDGVQLELSRGAGGAGPGGAGRWGAGGRARGGGASGAGRGGAWVLWVALPRGGGG